MDICVDDGKGAKKSNTKTVQIGKKKIACWPLVNYCSINVAATATIHWISSTDDVRHHEKVRKHSRMTDPVCPFPDCKAVRNQQQPLIRHISSFHPPQNSADSKLVTSVPTVRLARFSLFLRLTLNVWEDSLWDVDQIPCRYWRTSLLALNSSPIQKNFMTSADGNKRGPTQKENYLHPMNSRRS